MEAFQKGKAAVYEGPEGKRAGTVYDRKTLHDGQVYEYCAAAFGTAGLPQTVDGYGDQAFPENKVRQDFLQIKG